MNSNTVEDLEFRNLDQKELVLIDAVKGPTPEQADKAIAYYDSAYRAAQAANECLDDAKANLLTFIRTWGHPVAGSESSHQITGALNKAVMTIGRTTTLNETPIFELHNTLSEAGYDAFFDKLFTTRTRHEMVAGADNAIKTMNLPKKLTQQVLILYGQCLSTKDRAPSLKVDLLHKEPKQPRTRAKKAEVLA